jgi:hypothetical protein
MLVVVVVGTLNRRTLEQTAWLREVAEAGECYDLKPSFGYLPGHSWLSGLEPREYRNCFRYLFLPEKWPVEEAYVRIDAEGIIPEALRARVRFSERRRLDEVDYWQAQGSPHRTIFELAAKAGKTAKVSVWPKALEIASLESVSLRPNGRTLDFLYIEVGELDRIAHAQGVGSWEYGDGCGRLSRALDSLWSRIRELAGPSRIIVFGDGGAFPVENWINVGEIFDGLMGKDHEVGHYFVDSAIARVRLMTDEANGRFRCYPWERYGLRLLSRGDLVSLRFPFDEVIVGNVTIIPNHRACFAPNFFHVSRELSTHGLGELMPEEWPVIVVFPSRASSMPSMTRLQDIYWCVRAELSI